MSHVFEVGQLVRTTGRNADRSSGVYEIVRLMLAGPDGVSQYRVKSRDGERVMHESELQPV